MSDERAALIGGYFRWVQSLPVSRTPSCQDAFDAAWAARGEYERARAERLLAALEAAETAAMTQSCTHYRCSICGVFSVAAPLVHRADCPFKVNESFRAAIAEPAPDGGQE